MRVPAPTWSPLHRRAYGARLPLIWADRFIYSPRIKPIAKGGSTDVSKNYQSHRHHVHYWRPLQLYDLASDTGEQRNLVNPAERAALNMSGAEQKRLKGEL